MNKFASFAFAVVAALSLAACFPEHDYAGEYDMTYDVVLDLAPSTTDPTALTQVRAGLTNVKVRHGLGGDYLVDLGSSLCQLSGLGIEALTIYDWPYMQIAPQACPFAVGDAVYPLTLGGTATFGENDERFSIVLSGSFAGDKERGAATVELTETW